VLAWCGGADQTREFELQKIRTCADLARTVWKITRRYVGARVDLAFYPFRGARRQDAVPDLNVKDLAVKTTHVHFIEQKLTLALVGVRTTPAVENVRREREYCTI
jgi:predicted DNA-binding transcriptional regulator YafY